MMSTESHDYLSSSHSSFYEALSAIGMETTDRTCQPGTYVTAGPSGGTQSNAICDTVSGTVSKNDGAKGYSIAGRRMVGDYGGKMDDSGLFCYLRAMGEATDSDRSSTRGNDNDSSGRHTDMAVTDRVGGTAITGTGTHPLHSIEAILTHDQLQGMQPSLVSVHGAGHGVTAMGYYCPGIKSISNAAQYTTITQFGGFGDVVHNSVQGKNIH